MSAPPDVTARDACANLCMELRGAANEIESEPDTMISPTELRLWASRLERAVVALDAEKAPPEGPWRVKEYPVMSKSSPMDGWWQVLRGGMHTGHPQPSGSFETYDDAVAVRDALNRVSR